MYTVDECWEKVGLKIRPLKNYVVVRTFKLPEKTAGGIYLPNTDFYDGMANEKLIRALVLSTANKVRVVKSGDVIVFPRLYFARFEKLDDGTFLGWVEEPNIYAKIKDVNGDVALGPFTGVSHEDS